MKHIDQAEIEAERIRNNKCPKCGKDVKDKGSYIRCTSCNWALTNGTWSKDGYVIQLPD